MRLAMASSSLWRMKNAVLRHTPHFSADSRSGSHVHVALREPHPGRPVELGGGEDAHGGVGEGPGAPSAEEPLTAAPVSPPLHVMRGAAPGAGSVGIVFRPLACREVEKLRVYQRLERSQGPALLGSRHLREELPRQLGEHVFHCNLHLS